jgi:hypothetical protein
VNDDLLRSLNASRKAAHAFRLPKETIEKLGQLSQTSRLLTEQLRHGQEVTRQFANVQEAMRPVLQAQESALRPPPSIVLRDPAPLRTQRAAEAMLAELQTGAKRERRMFWLAVLSVGVAIVSTAANVLPALLG